MGQDRPSISLHALFTPMSYNRTPDYGSEAGKRIMVCVPIPQPAL